MNSIYLEGEIELYFLNEKISPLLNDLIKRDGIPIIDGSFISMSNLGMKRFGFYVSMAQQGGTEGGSLTQEKANINRYFFVDVFMKNGKFTGNLEIMGKPPLTIDINEIFTEFRRDIKIDEITKDL